MLSESDRRQWSGRTLSYPCVFCLPYSCGKCEKINLFPDASDMSPDNKQELQPRVSVLIPCKNEEKAIAQVIQQFRHELPGSEIIVCDNNSSDNTAEVARKAGAIVLSELRPGKGNAIRKLFSASTGSICVMVDGDATYSSADVHKLMQPVLDGQADMVVARRTTPGQELDAAYRKGHQFGNRLFSLAMSKMLNYPLDDVFSGYRVMSRRFVNSFPCLSAGFEIETELTVHTADLGLTLCEIDSQYGSRTDGSVSKLNTFRDGTRIALVLAHLYSQIKPVRFFGAIAGLLALISLALGIPLVVHYLETGLVPRFPTAILASALALMSGLFLGSGLILDSVSRGRKEMKRLFYLATK
jgi:glycosyltransferase involved in cell wall biosynthesis